MKPGEPEVRPREHAMTASGHRVKEPDLDWRVAGHAGGGRAPAARVAVAPYLPTGVVGAHEEGFRVRSTALVEDAVVRPELGFVVERALVQANYPRMTTSAR